MQVLVFMRECPLGPLMLAVHKLCVIGQAFIVADVLVQGISIVSCVKRTKEHLLKKGMRACLFPPPPSNIYIQQQLKKEKTRSLLIRNWDVILVGNTNYS